MLNLLAELGLSFESHGLLLEDGHLVRLSLGERNGCLVAFTDHEQVLAAGGEGVAVGFFHVDDIE